MFFGQFSPAIFFKLCSCLILSSLVIIYYLSQWYGHEPPFPQQSISGCAGHYPQFIFFRIATISGSVLLLLGWLTNHFYIKSISREAAFNISPYHPEIAMIFGTMGAILLMGSTANIDTGKRNQKWHLFCASRFFIFTTLAQIYNTFICCIVRKKIGKIHVYNLYAKLVNIALMVLQIVVSLKYGFSQIIDPSRDSLGSDIGNLIEWTFTGSLLIGMYSMGIDAQQFKFVYQLSPSSGPGRNAQ